MEQLFEGKKIRIALFVVLILLGVFLAVQAIAATMELRYIGTGITPTNTIVVSGHGEAFKAPDIATFTFSVVSDKPTVAAAQQDAATKINAVTNYLVQAGVSANDIQTSDYSIQPQYSYEQGGVCPALANIPCPPSKQVLTGYEVRQTTTVKVRDISKAGDLLSGVGQQGASEVSSLTMTFNDPNEVQDMARSNAIANAKQKATSLAQQLGVSLVRVVSFNENLNGGNPLPIMEGVRTMAASASAPVISPGQTTVTDDVSITYEIR